MKCPILAFSGGGAWLATDYFLPAPGLKRSPHHARGRFRWLEAVLWRCQQSGTAQDGRGRNAVEGLTGGFVEFMRGILGATAGVVDL